MNRRLLILRIKMCLPMSTIQKFIRAIKCELITIGELSWSKNNSEAQINLQIIYQNALKEIETLSPRKKKMNSNRESKIEKIKRWLQSCSKISKYKKNKMLKSYKKSRRIKIFSMWTKRLRAIEWQSKKEKRRKWRRIETTSTK